MTGFGVKESTQGLQSPKKGRVIDLVLLASQTKGDSNFEIEILWRFNQSISLHYKNLLASSSEKETKACLYSLKKESFGVGAKTLVSLIVIAEEEVSSKGALDDEMKDDIGFAVAEVKQFIATILN